MFYKKTVTFLQNFAIFTGKYLRWILFFIKLQAFTSATLLKISSNISVSLLQNFCERPILKNICVRQLVNWLYEVNVCNFVSGQSLSKPSWLIILQKYQSLWSLSFKHNLAHMPYLDLIPTRHFFCLHQGHNRIFLIRYIFIFLQVLQWEKKSQNTQHLHNNDYANVIKSIKVILNAKQRTNKTKKGEWQ